MMPRGIARRRGARRAPWAVGSRVAAFVPFAAVGVAALAACGPPEPPSLRVWTDSYEFRVTSDPSPPRASEPTVYRIVVLDRETRQFIENGEGQVFATSEDRKNIYDSFEPAKELGTYTARLNYITAGDWKVNLRFRRDSTAPIEKPVDDWVQTVRAARPLSERPFTDAPDTAGGGR